MQHVRYPAWSRFILDIAARHHVAPRRILEIACGTGTMAALMAQSGRRVMGMDRCLEMLQVARAKCGGPNRFVQGDMRALPFAGEFDLVLCLYDSINYLLNPKEITGFLTTARRLIKPNGIFVFDICTEYNSRHFFSDFYDQDTGDNFFYERHSRFLARQRQQVNRFTLCFQEKNGRVSRHHEEHRQHIYRDQEIRDLITDTGLYTFAAYDGFTFQPPHPTSTRIHYVLRPIVAKTP
jgi:ubiquinone/menaquinone biosynthesis C-methylase UbiE